MDNLIVNKRIGISSEDVKCETNQETLKSWLYDIQSEISMVKNQLTTAKQNKADGISSDKDWFRKASDYKVVQTALRFMIQKRLSELKAETKNINIENNMKIDFWKNKVRELLDEDDFELCIQELKFKQEELV